MLQSDGYAALSQVHDWLCVVNITVFTKVNCTQLEAVLISLNCRCSDFGCSDEKEHFDNLLKFSPIHNVKLPDDVNVQYPAVLLLTADHDDR